MKIPMHVSVTTGVSSIREDPLEDCRWLGQTFHHRANNRTKDADKAFKLDTLCCEQQEQVSSSPQIFIIL